MPRPSKHQSDQYIKNANSKDLFKKPKVMITESDIKGDKRERLKSWITFYRHNLSFFVEHYMDIKLFPYQRYWVSLMGRSTIFLAIASRATAKSWLIAVYSIARCILYPGTIITLNSSTKQQAGLIISEKCRDLYNKSLNIQRECTNIVTNQNVWEMAFHNGSKITAVVSGEGGRGRRSHVSVLEERRLIPTIIIDSIIRPFLVSRQPPYVLLEKYANLPREESQEIIITSAYYKSYEWWTEAKQHLKMIADGDPDVKAVFLDYLILLKHGLKTKKQLQKEKEKSDPISFLMEYGNIPYSSSTDSFYKVGLFKRDLKVTWRPQRDIDYEDGKNKYDLPHLAGERRIVSVDIAMRRGSVNDNTIISCATLAPSNRGMITNVVHMESHNGKNTSLQALRIKQIFYEFTKFNKDSVLVLDIANAGISVFDALTSVTQDEVRGIEYPAMTVMEHPDLDQKICEELRDRTLSQNAIPCIFPITGTSALNSAIAVSFRDRLKRKLLHFPCDDFLEEEYLIRSGNKDILDQNDPGLKSHLLNAHFQTTLMINEAISLERGDNDGGFIKLKEPSGARKDRYSAVSYLNYFISLLDKEYLKESADEDDFYSIASLVQSA